MKNNRTPAKVTCRIPMLNSKLKLKSTCDFSGGFRQCNIYPLTLFIFIDKLSTVRGTKVGPVPCEQCAAACWSYIPQLAFKAAAFSGFPRVVHIHHQAALWPDQFQKPVLALFIRPLQCPQKIIHGLKCRFGSRVSTGLPINLRTQYTPRLVLFGHISIMILG